MVIAIGPHQYVKRRMNMSECERQNRQKRKYFETLPEDGKRRCRCDVRWQIVPYVGAGD